jgi:hypothetical protein
MLGLLQSDDSSGTSPSATTRSWSATDPGCERLRPAEQIRSQVAAVMAAGGPSSREDLFVEVDGLPQ